MNNALKSVPTLNTDVVSPRFHVLPLNTEFSSFGEAFYSWVNSDGIVDGKNLNTDMVKAFCFANQHSIAAFGTEVLLQNYQYFASTEWFEQYLIKNNYYRIGCGTFYKLDKHNRPIAYIDINGSQKHNFDITYTGDEEIGRVLHGLIFEHVSADERVEEKPKFYEVIFSNRYGVESLVLTPETIENERTSLPEYYPFLDGGVNALFEDFLNSDESVLILMGPPGTGKTSAVTSIVNTMNILPIYGKRSEATLHKDFTSFIFNTSDRYMSEVAGTAAKERTDLFTDHRLTENEFWYNKPPTADTECNEIKPKELPRIPMIVVEDADILLSPRSAGNLAMAQMLNETDGVSSNHDRKIVFLTNLSKRSDIEEALMREGRCYDVIEFRLLTPAEAIAARKAHGLPDFEETPTKDMSLAAALRKPRKRVFVKNGKVGIGFNVVK